MPLSSLLGSAALRRVLVHFAARPGSRLHFRALERRLGLSRQSLKNALDTLEELGLIERSLQGNRAVYTARADARWQSLRSLIRDFATPAEVVGDLLQGIPGIRAAGVFGSAARGAERPESDLDVLVVADRADPGELGFASLEIGALLDREVDLKCYTPEKLREERERPGTGYLKRVLSGPVLWSLGHPDSGRSA